MEIEPAQEESKQPLTQKEIDKMTKAEKKAAKEREKERQREAEKNEAKKELEEQMLDPFKMINIEQIVAFSISQCRDAEQQKKMANNILIVGGISCIKQFSEEFEDRFIDATHLFCPEVERVEVIDTSVKEISPANLSWLGATVIPRLESTKDMWITRNRWMGNCQDEVQEEEENGQKIFVKKEKSNEFGIRYLKEKIPFQW